MEASKLGGFSVTEVINREATHGDFSEHADISQSLKYTMRQSKNWDGLGVVPREALEMVQHKIARILTGDPNVVDHWDDIIGYVSRVTERFVREAPKPKTIGGVGQYGDTGEDSSFHPRVPLT